jgi:O-antigen ligase
MAIQSILERGNTLSNRIERGPDHSDELASNLGGMPASVRRQEIIEAVCLFLLFFSCTIPYTVVAGSVIVSPSEILAFVFILWRWAVGGKDAAVLDRGIRRLIWGFRIFAVWSGILWLFSNDWIDRRGMFVDWVLAALLAECLVRSPWKDWRRTATLFVLAAIPTAVWAILQRAMGIGLAPKDLAGWGRHASSFPIMGFFGHSNDLAAYLYWPLLVCVGLVLAFSSRRRIAFALLAILYAVVMYFTISRTTLVALVFVAVIAALALLIRRRSLFTLAVAAGAGFTAIAIAWIFTTVPRWRIDAVLSGRLELWNRGLQLIFSDKFLLPFGYSLGSTANNPSIWWLPHNIYSLAWLEFGWPGILGLIGLGVYLIYTGWKRYVELRRRFWAIVLWGGLAGLFLIGGMADLYFHEPYVILNFICVLGLWAAMLREMDAHLASKISDVPSTKSELASR